jgi:4-hydroxy-tetrahydrodipicolinate synthase
MSKTEFKGTGTAIVTPFKKDLSIDFDALKKLIEFQIKGGVNFLVVQGTTGESPTLSGKEKQQLLEFVAEVNNKRLPIVYGVGGNNTMDVFEKLKSVNTNIVDGILSVSPYYNKPTQEGIFQHYKYISEATDLPIILYNVPGRTSMNVVAETTLRLAEIKNIVAVKEASGNMDQIMEILRCRPADFTVLSGDDPLTLPIIACGGDGVISVVSNGLPEKFCAMVQFALKRDFENARKLHFELLHITRLFFAEGNPGGIKETLKTREIMDHYMRLPLVNVSPSLQKEIKEETLRILATK